MISRNFGVKLSLGVRVFSRRKAIRHLPLSSPDRTDQRFIKLGDHMEAVPKSLHAKIRTTDQIRTNIDLLSGLLDPQWSSVATLVR